MKTFIPFRCVVCRSTGLRAVDPEDSGLYCAGCGAEFPVSAGIPIFVRNQEEHAEAIEQAQSANPAWYVDEQPPESESPWRHHLKKRRRFVELTLREELEARGESRFERVLDLGCGDGNHLVWLRDYAVELHGSDYNLRRLVRAAKANPVATLFLADLLNYPAPDDFYDLIFFNHVIEHIPEDVEALKAIHRILKPGGMLVLGTPNEGAWWWQLAYRRAPETLASTDHVHFYTAETLSEKVSRAGFQIRTVHHMGWGPPDWRLDGKWRKYKAVDDAFEFFGKILIPRQASSLYVLASKATPS